MLEVFISYSRQDQEFAARLASSLAAIQANVWIDVDKIQAGVKWSTAIQQGLEQSELLLIVLSPDGMASTNVEDEWQWFLDQKKRVIPLLYRPTQIHFQLSRLQYINFTNKDYDSAFRDLYHEIQRHGFEVGELPGDSKPKPPPERPTQPPLVTDPMTIPSSDAPMPVSSPHPLPIKEALAASSINSPYTANSAAKRGRSRGWLLGIVGVVVLIALALIFVVFSSGTPPSATATASATVRAVAVVPSPTPTTMPPSATLTKVPPSATLTPIPATATATIQPPTAESTENSAALISSVSTESVVATAEATEAAATAEASATSEVSAATTTAEATSAATGLELIYDANTLTLINHSDKRINISSLTFVQQAANGTRLSFSATQWANTGELLASMGAGECYQLWITGLTMQPAPSDCTHRIAWRAVGLTRWFWKSDQADATFEVRRSDNDLLIATCTISAGQCTLEL